MSKIVKSVIKSCNLQCQSYYKKAPKVNLTSLIVNDNGTHHKDVISVYVPNHLEVIVSELLKNALRATVENYQSTDIPPVEILIVKCRGQITIKISDRGGGATLAEQSK